MVIILLLSLSLSPLLQLQYTPQNNHTYSQIHTHTYVHTNKHKILRGTVLSYLYVKQGETYINIPNKALSYKQVNFKILIFVFQC